MTPAPDPRFRLVRSLESFAASHPFCRKVVVSRTFGEGSELLRALALHVGGWIGFEVSTPARLATEVAGPTFAGDGIDLLDEFGQSALIDEALDRVFSARDWGAFHRLEEGTGFRDAVAGAVYALRLGGIKPAALGAADFSDTRRRAFVEAMLSEYEDLLAERVLADTADVLARAAERIAEQPDLLGDAIVVLVPGLSVRGVAGDLVAALRTAGGQVLETDGVKGSAAPKDYLWNSAAGGPFSGLLSGTPPKRALGKDRLHLFSAASVADELTEVLRLAMARGLSWDAVEIVTPDPITYGTALHALSRRLGIPVSFGVGLPVARTRPGRAIHIYLRWIENGFPAELLRGLFESGDLVAPSRHGGVPPAALGRRLRRLRVGWGRQRYVAAIEAARRTLEAETTPWPHETTEDATKRVESTLLELDALEAVIRRLDRFTPDLADDPTSEDHTVSPADLARGVRAFLEMVPEGEGGDAIARQDLLLRLGRIIEALRRPTTLVAALSILRRHLKIRVRAAWDEGSPPWKSTGGHVHLTDLEHGGLTGRRATFIVGLDAARFPGPGFQDPILLDSDRQALDPELPTAHEGLTRRRFELAALAARIRGQLTLSYTAWNPAEARTVQPSPVMLQAFRIARGDPDATYEELHGTLGLPRGVIPRDGHRLDGQDVWMGALGGGGVLLDAEESIRQVFPGLDAGLTAQATRRLDVASSHHGLISVEGDRLDPRRNENMVLSASRLESLGTCPLRYLLRYVLRIKPPDDPSMDPDHWLDALQRGSLLHGVFDRALRDAREQGMDATDPAFEGLALDVLDQEANRMVGRVPAPSRAVKGREVAELREDVRSFVEIVRQTGAPWVHLELAFGRGGSPPVSIELADGSVTLAGAVDRVDELAEGLRLVDYKTGRTYTFSAESGVTDGGRRLQHIVYAHVVEGLLDTRVHTVEYHFPTPRGENAIHSFERSQLESGLDLIGALLDQVTAGRFLPTDEPGDCRVCDYKDVCRVRPGGRELSSPMAEWGQRNRELLPEYGLLKAVRSWETSG